MGLPVLRKPRVAFQFTICRKNCPSPLSRSPPTLKKLFSGRDEWSPPLPHSREQRDTSPKITCIRDGWSLSPEQPCCPLFECTKKENVHRHSLFLYLGSTRRRQGPYPGSRSDAPGLLRDRDTACPCLASLLLTETGSRRPDRRPSRHCHRSK